MGIGSHPQKPTRYKSAPRSKAWNLSFPMPSGTVHSVLLAGRRCTMHIHSRSRTRNKFSFESTLRDHTAVSGLCIVKT